MGFKGPLKLSVFICGGWIRVWSVIALSFLFSVVVSSHPRVSGNWLCRRIRVISRPQSTTQDRKWQKPMKLSSLRGKI